MKKTIFLFLTFLPFVVFSQNEKLSCSSLKSFKNNTKSSNSLTVEQIAEMEKYDVKYYSLDLNMTDVSTTMSGEVKMMATARVDLDSALYELYHSMAISEIRVNDVPTPFYRNDNVIKVPVNVEEGETFTIATVYAGTPPNAATNPLGGGGMTHKKDPYYNIDVTWSLSEAYAAYEWFPVKQSLRDKADSVDVWITVPDYCLAGSNGMLQQVVDLGDGTRQFYWKHRHPIAHYLISVAVAKYKEINIYAHPVGSDSVLIQNFVYDHPSIPNSSSQYDATADFIELFSDLFGLYPFANEKYGHCYAPLGGAMEHQTMTTTGSFGASIVAHELAHQWYGDYVTCASWADIWVNEGFASYSEYLMYEFLHPGNEVENMASRHTNIMSQPGGSVWAKDSLNESVVFSGRLTYNKGAAILHIIRFLVGDDDVFFEAMKQILIDFGYYHATGMDIFGVFEDVAGIDLTEFAEQWYFGEGFPTYGVNWNVVGDDLHLKISQETSMPSITPYFTNDLELSFQQQNQQDTTIRFVITGVENEFVLHGMGGVLTPNGIDPNNWIINDESGIVKDNDFIAHLEESETYGNDILIFPNPTDGIFKIDMKEMGNYEVIVLDEAGKTVLNKAFNGELDVDISKYAAGKYLILVSGSNNGTVMTKIVKN